MSTINLNYPFRVGVNLKPLVPSISNGMVPYVTGIFGVLLKNTNLEFAYFITAVPLTGKLKRPDSPTIGTMSLSITY